MTNFLYLHHLFIIVLRLEHTAPSGLSSSGLTRGSKPENCIKNSVDSRIKSENDSSSLFVRYKMTNRRGIREASIDFYIKLRYNIKIYLNP